MAVVTVLLISVSLYDDVVDVTSSSALDVVEIKYKNKNKFSLVCMEATYD